LSLIFGVLKLVNFSHGEFYMLGGYFYYYLTKAFHVTPLLALLLTILSLFFIGWVVEKTLIKLPPHRVVGRKDEYTILITFGLSIFLQNLALAAFGPWNKQPVPILSGRITFGDLVIGGDRLIASFVGVLLIGGVLYVLGRTFWGWGIRAVSQDVEASAIVGIRPEKVKSLTFGIGVALAGAAGALIGPVFLVHSSMGTLPAVKAFVIIVLGGLGSIKGSLLGALILGEIESLGSVFFPDPDRAMAYKDAYGLLILMCVLLLKPSGLFGERGRKT
jgi:branched-chain amino acid transport system permease protein